jgi:dTDP-4-dehydrorhamnose 3,5-epimerase
MLNDPPTHEQQLYEASLRDQETVTEEGQSLQRYPSGVSVRPLLVHSDDRGEVMEMMDPRWGWHPAPLIFTYCSTIRPGWAKGWGMHRRHDDRYCLMRGRMKLVLFDPREDSPTKGMVSEIYLVEKSPVLVSIPIGVWHADENVGETEVIIVNFPTIPYDHADPDKYRLPLHTDLIPYRFDPSVRGY